MERIATETAVDPSYHDLQFPAPGDDRPYTVINMVSSVDGRITVGGRLPPQSLGSAADRRVMDSLRAHADAVLCGAGTFRAHPFFLGVPKTDQARRQERGLAPQPVTVILSGSGCLPADSPRPGRAAPGPVLVVGPETMAAAPRASLQSKAELELLPGSSIDFPAMLRCLRQKYQIKMLLVEGGARINYQFFAGGWVDELFFTMAPEVHGGQNDKTMVMGSEPFDPLIRLELRSILRHHDELFFRYAVRPQKSLKG